MVINMIKKQFIVFGLGIFGKSVAIALEESDCEIMVIDNDKEKIEDIASEVTHAVCMDVTDEEALQELGIGNFDGAIVAIGTNLEASVMVTILAKEMGIPFVLAKASSSIHARVLRRVGADKIVFPEKDSAIRIAHNLLFGNFFDAIILSPTYSIMEIDALVEWNEKTLKELELRVRYKFNVIGIKGKGKNSLNINPDAETKIQNGDVLIVIGENKKLDSFLKKNQVVEEGVTL